MEGSITGHTLMHGLSRKAAALSLFSERVKITLGNFFPFTMGARTNDEIDTQEEGDNNEKFLDF